MTAVNQLTQIEAIMDESLEQTVSKIVERALEVRLNRLVERVVSNVTDELSGLASNVEDVIADAVSSAERAGELDPDLVNELEKDLAETLLQKIREKNLLAEEAPHGPTIAERYHTGQLSIEDALYEALDVPVLTNEQVNALLKMLSTNYEPAFALFLWRNKNGAAS